MGKPTDKPDSNQPATPPGQDPNRVPPGQDPNWTPPGEAKPRPNQDLPDAEDDDTISSR